MAQRHRELSDRRASLPPLQFSIRSILLLTLCVAMLTLAVRELYYRFGGPVASVAILTTMSIVAHLSAAALGDRLRSSKDLTSPHERSEEDGNETRLIQPMQAQLTDFAPATQLSHQKPLKLRSIYVSIGVGAVFCAIVAAIVLTWFMWDDLAVANVLFGAASASVIGGLFGFLIGSFCQVVSSALAEARENT